METQSPTALRPIRPPSCDGPPPGSAGSASCWLRDNFDRTGARSSQHRSDASHTSFSSTRRKIPLASALFAWTVCFIAHALANGLTQIGKSSIMRRHFKENLRKTLRPGIERPCIGHFARVFFMELRATDQHRKGACGPAEAGSAPHRSLARGPGLRRLRRRPCGRFLTRAGGAHSP